MRRSSRRSRLTQTTLRWSSLTNMYVCRQKKKRMKRKKLWLERWRPLPTPTPPSCLSKETVTIPATLQMCRNKSLRFSYHKYVKKNQQTDGYKTFPSRLPGKRHRQVPARLHQQGLRELHRRVSGRLFPLPSGAKKTHFPPSQRRSPLQRCEHGDQWLLFPRQDYQFYIQNFTALQLGTVVPSGRQATFEYSFIPAEPMGGRPFGLVINLNYKDNAVRTRLEIPATEL